MRKRLINSGYDRPVYDIYRTEIVKQNNRLVETTSFIGSIIMVMLTIAAVFMPSIGKVLPLYLTIAVLFSMIYIVARFIGSKYWTIAIVCNYAFLAVAFFFAMGLDVIQKNATATTVCVLLVALPLLIVDKPYREGAFFIVMALAFMFETVYIKHSPKASIDVLNAISFVVIGSFLGYKHNQMMLRNMVAQDMLVKERDTDSLTELYNKGALEKRAVALLREEGMTASLFVIDMDNFKFINDTYGHHVGDEILVSIGKALKNVFEPEGLISRFGGDEFTVFLPGVVEPDALKAKAQSVLDTVKTIRIEADLDYRANICMGIATYPKDGSDYETLFRNTDSAMYHVKKNGKDGFKIYDKDEKQKILIVDDVEVNRVVLRETLKDEFDIFEASNGKKALELLYKENDIAMVITDIKMPEMDGIELTRQLRANTRWDDVAIIANTQYGDMKMDEDMYYLGVDDFVYKPSSPKVIQLRVKNVLKSKENYPLA